jgi:hypothetical protein
MEMNRRKHLRTWSLAGLVLALALGSGLAHLAWAATPIYVRPGGDDTLCNGTVDVDYSGGVAPYCAIQTIQKGVDLVDAGGTVYVRTGTYVLAAQVSVNKANITLAGDGIGNTIVQVSLTGYRFYISASGVTLQGFEIQKTDKTGEQNIIYVGSNDVTIKDNLIFGQFVIGEGDVSRALEVAYGTSNLTVQGNTIHSLRQPGYLNGSLASPTTGNITGNDVYLTKGWVLAGANMTFTGNTWGSGGDANVYDIVILSGTDASYYPDIVAVSAANNNAVVEDQRPVPAVLSDVFVDDSAPAGGAGGAREPYQTIALAIARVVARGTIYVAAGTYNERITINKALDLRGAQYGVDPTPPGARTTPGNESTIDISGLGPSNPNVAVEVASGVSNATVAGLTIVGSPISYYADESNVRAWNSNITIQDNILTGWLGILYKGPGNSLTVARNRMSVNKNGVVVQPNSATGVVITGNKIVLGTGPGGDENAVYMTSCSGCQVSGNTCTGFVNGAGVAGSNHTNLTVLGNTFSGNKKGVSFWGNTTFASISGNTITGSTVNGIEIKGQDIAISGNTITGGATGIWVDKHTLATERVTIYHNTISGTSGFGLVVTAPVVQTVVAENNYWGTTVPSEVMAEVSGNADYDPWCNSDFSICSFTMPVHNITKGLDYPTIQAAVAAATPGDEIHVDAGTLVETGQIVIDKNLTIAGAGRAATIVKPAQDTGSSGDAKGWWLIQAGRGLNLSHLTLDGTGHKVFQALRIQGHGTIEDVAFTQLKYNPSGPDYAGLAVVAYGDGPVDISDCTFNQIGRVGVLYYGTGVSGSTFAGNIYTGKGDGDWLDYALDISAGAEIDVLYNTISGNRGVASSDGSTSAGVLITTYYAPTTHATLTGNALNANTTGIAVGYDAGDTSVVVVHDNCIEGNTSEGVSSTAPTVDAQGNWWGDATGPYHPAKNRGGTGDAVSDYIDFEPWVADHCHGTVTTGNWQNLRTLAYDDLQGSLDAAAYGDTIEAVGASPLAGGGVANVGGVTLDLNGKTVGPGSPFLTVNADDVTVLGPGTIDGGGGGGSGIVVQGGADNFILQNAEVTGWTDGIEVAGDVTSLKLVDNWIHTNTQHGLHVDAGVDLDGIVTIEGNLFKVNTGNGIQHDGNGTLPAEYNSWGDIEGSASGDGIGGLVDAEPYTYIESFFDVWPDTLALERHVPEATSFDVALKADAVKVYGLTFQFGYDNAKLTLNSTVFSAPWAGKCFAMVGLPAGEVGYYCNLNAPGDVEWTVTAGTVATFNFTAYTGLGGNGPWEALFDLSHLELETSASAIGGQKVYVNNAGFNAPSVPERDITDTNDGRVLIDGQANYRGFVDLQGRANDSGALVEVHVTSTYNSTLLATGTSASSGVYQTAYQPGQLMTVGTVYWLYADRALYLPTTVMYPGPAASYAHSKLLDTRPLTALGTLLLLGGDATSNNYIDIGDLSCIGADYGKTTGFSTCGGAGLSDVNGDNKVNVQDLSLGGGNFYKTSSPWTP